jgi:hypothetical protein
MPVSVIPSYQVAVALKPSANKHPDSESLCALMACYLGFASISRQRVICPNYNSAFPSLGSVHASKVKIHCQEIAIRHIYVLTRRCIQASF